MRVDTRWVIPSDIEELLKIEHCCYQNGWSDDLFKKVLNETNTVGIVAISCEHIVGFVIYERNDKLKTILNMAVHPQLQRCGIGTKLMKKLIAISKLESSISASIRESSLIPQLFLRSLGFIMTNVTRNLCTEPNEDAYTMEYSTPTWKGHNRIAKFIKTGTC